MAFFRRAIAALPRRPSSALMAAHVWEKQEVVLTASQQFKNGYTDVTVWVDLTGPDFKKRIYGFWDGGKTFRVRLSQLAGKWTWHELVFPETRACRANAARSWPRSGPKRRRTQTLFAAAFCGHC